MRFISWNVWFRNSDPATALRFIESEPWDVLCLQEVSEGFLEQLAEVQAYSAISVDVDRLFESGIERNYLVILSKFPITTTSSIELPLPHIPRRTHRFIRLIGWSQIANRTALWADLALPNGQSMRAWCLHTVLAHPAVRIGEFEKVLHANAALPPKSAIICGDLNTLDTPKAALINYPLGGRFTDSLFWWRERVDMEKRFMQHELVNPHRGLKTYPYSGAQLSHILVPKHWRIQKSDLIPHRYGSDHYPIFLDCDVSS